MARNKLLDFKCNNPGAVRYGNFINYYDFHPPKSRLSLLPTNFWGDLDYSDVFCILDIGCNSGDLTLSLQDFIAQQIPQSKCYTLGIDIDPTLIERANEKIKNQKQESIAFQCVDIMTEQKSLIGDYMASKEIKKFNTIFCFSVTMWIHLNYGDDGLRTFLKYVSNNSEVLVIEPQPWKCYKSAVKRLKSSGEQFPFIKDLQIRKNVESFIDEFLCNECKRTKVYETICQKWGRKILIFR